jgi:NADH pyrophosphatase NudC (nudix superfamily)
LSLEPFRYCPRCGKPLALRALLDADGNASQRQACEDACGYVQWGNPVPVVGALVEHEGEIVLARNAGWPAGFFALVTGYLETNEDPVKAVAREVKEELALDVVESHLIGNYIFERKNEVVMCYHALATGTIRLGAELAEYRRHKPAELRPWRRATGLAVADWMRSRGLPFEWDERPPLQAEPAKT